MMRRDNMIRALTRMAWELHVVNSRIPWQEMRVIFRRTESLVEQMIGADLLGEAVRDIERDIGDE
jgi:hypothetical protein